MFQENRKAFKGRYEQALQAIRNPNTILTHTCRNPAKLDEKPTISIRRTNLCLQCPYVLTDEVRNQHINDKKHQFYVESRQGSVYCGSCKDYVYDPELERMRTERGW
jgi:ubiquitin carboxyl-terminal hydrolase 22/27/51